jgi:hypothetical protein
MTTNTGQINPRIQKFVLQLLVIFALLATVVLVGYIWNSQRVLRGDKPHLTYAGAQILMWGGYERLGPRERFGRESIEWYLRMEEELTMTPAAAAFLARSYGNILNMHSVLQLSPSVARGLSQTRHGLRFNNLELTSPEVLAALVSGPCPNLTLPIPNLTEAGAKALSQFKGDYLTLTQMAGLSPEAAKALSRCETVGLSLEGLDHLSEEAAEELSRCRAGWLAIGGGWLKSSSSTLSLRSLDSISETTASALSRFQGRSLTLYVKHISEEVAVALSHYPGLLALTTLETLPDAAAHALAGRKLLKVGLATSDGSHQLEKLPASAAAILRAANNNSQ